LEEETLMRAILEAVYSVLGCEYVIVSTVCEEAGTIGIRHGIWGGGFDVFPEWIQMSQYPLDHPDILADIYRTGRTEIIREWDERFNREIWDEFGHERFLRIFMPIKIRGRVLGVVEVSYDKREKDHIAEDEVQMLAAFMDQVAVALENARLYEAEQKERRVAETLREVSEALGSTLEPNRVLNLILEQLGKVVDYDSACVILLSDDVLKVVASRGYPRTGATPETSLTLDEDLPARQIFDTKQPLVLRDAQEDERFRSLPGAEHVLSWIGVPLIAADKVIGLLTGDYPYLESKRTFQPNVVE
jgi:GAF domain-containing protein